MIAVSPFFLLKVCQQLTYFHSTFTNSIQMKHNLSLSKEQKKNLCNVPTVTLYISLSYSVSIILAAGVQVQESQLMLSKWEYTALWFVWVKGEGGGVEQNKFNPKLAYFQLTLLYFPPLSLNPNGPLSWISVQLNCMPFSFFVHNLDLCKAACHFLFLNSSSIFFLVRINCCLFGLCNMLLHAFWVMDHCDLHVLFLCLKCMSAPF